ncbi:MAG: hypothetical protein EOL87_11545 [Spartobacteria bacterium]|nr:hypothetical protein [Spartobacteria bacterium]
MGLLFVALRRFIFFFACVLIFWVGNGYAVTGYILSQEPGIADGRRLEIAEDAGKINVIAENVSAKEVLNGLQQVSGVDLQIDDRLTQLVDFKVYRASLEEVLDKLSMGTALVYDTDNEGCLRLLSATALSEEKRKATLQKQGVVRNDDESEVLRASHILTNSEKPLADLRTYGASSILLRNAMIDTENVKRGEVSLDVPLALRADANNPYQIVQFDSATGLSGSKLLKEQGIDVLTSIRNFAYVVRVDEEQLAVVRDMSSVTAVVPFHPYFKMAPDVLDAVVSCTNDDDQTAKKYGVSTFQGVSRKQAERLLSDVSIEHVTQLNDAWAFTVLCEPARVAELSRIPEINWVQRMPELQMMNDLASRHTKASAFHNVYTNYQGQGVTVAVLDSGIDFENPGFSVNASLPTSTNMNSRIVYYGHKDRYMYDTNGHGTHVAGSIAGNGALSSTVNKAPGSGSAPYGSDQFKGVAPGANLVVLNDFNSYLEAEPIELAYEQGARIANNSWGVSYNVYDLNCQIYDQRVRDALPDVDGDQPYIVFFGAGNTGAGNDDGSGGNMYTIGAPGLAKNVITVGAVEQSRFANNIENIVFVSGTNSTTRNALQETDSNWQVSKFSSRGPVSSTDFRYKPDVMAPGAYVLSVQSKYRQPYPDSIKNGPVVDDYRAGNVDSGTNFMFMSGTSMSTPIAAGNGALIYQWYTNTYGQAPSPALMKAILVNSATMLNSRMYAYPTRPNNSSSNMIAGGWGMVNAMRAIEGGTANGMVKYIDQDQVTSLFAGNDYSIDVDLGDNEGGCRITLAWTDKAAELYAASALVNDLDLDVKTASGTYYIGNYFDSDMNSTAYDHAIDQSWYDGYNNVEVISIPPGAGKGKVTITVRGWKVSADTPQDFALAIMSGIGAPTTPLGYTADMNIDSKGRPVVAFVHNKATDGNDIRRLHVLRWNGTLGYSGESDYWFELENQWEELDGSASGNGISYEVTQCQYPSIATYGDEIYAAWLSSVPASSSAFLYPYVRKFDGHNWVELGGSAQGTGLSDSGAPAANVLMKVSPAGVPIVAFKRSYRTADYDVYRRPFITYWNGSTWTGFGGSDITGVTLVDYVMDFDVELDPSGYPVLAWVDIMDTEYIKVARWNGTSWDRIGDVRGNGDYVNAPDLTISDNGTIYLGWIDLITDVDEVLISTRQIYVKKYLGGTSWGEMAGSASGRGVSQSTNALTRPIDWIRMDATDSGKVAVTWVGSNNGTNSTLNATNAVYVKLFDGISWKGVEDSDVFPGVRHENNRLSRPVVQFDQTELPVVTMTHDQEQTALNQPRAITVAAGGDRHAPIFGGIISAEGNTSGQVKLRWNIAHDDSAKPVGYLIYRGANTTECGQVPDCEASDVFAHPIAQVGAVLEYVDSTATPGYSHCYGVRAIDSNGNIDDNIQTRSGSPITLVGDSDHDCLGNAEEVAISTDPCNPDTDIDGMWDGWEWFYSTNNPAHLSMLNMNPLDNGLVNVRTGDAGDPLQAGTADLDGDGASNVEEFNWYTQHHGGECLVAGGTLISPDPTAFDTDGDGMPDGWEILNTLDPTDPADAAEDPDNDRLINLEEYKWGTNPYKADTDGDGLDDGEEVLVVHTDPSLTDSDQDGLDDGFEIKVGSNPTLGSSNGSGISDGVLFELGYDQPQSPVSSRRVFLQETFEAGSPTLAGWSHAPISAAAPDDLWHLSKAEPAPSAHPGIKTAQSRSMDTSYRFSLGTNFESNVSNSYNLARYMSAALISPTLNVATSKTLFVSWNEYFYTEPMKDTVQLQIQVDDALNWIPVDTMQSGKSGVQATNANQSAQWVARQVDLTEFVGTSNITLRFVFKSDRVNNDHPFQGWFVDDVTVYEGAGIVTGWVVNANGQALQGVTVRALGRGGVTNRINGHLFVNPGTIFSEAKTAADGSFQMNDLLMGHYLFKAELPEYYAEFYNGTLCSNNLYAYGNGQHPGVYTRMDVTTNGYVALTNCGTGFECDFELDPGKGNAWLGVKMNDDSSQTVYLNGRDGAMAAKVWNGVASTNPASYGRVPYKTSSTNWMYNAPDWLNQPEQPNQLNDLEPGTYQVYAGARTKLYPIPEVVLREGEMTLLGISDDQTGGFLDVVAQDDVAYSVKIDCQTVSGLTTPIRNYALPAGLHCIELVSPDANRIAPQYVTVPYSTKATATFITNALSGAAGIVRLHFQDIHMEAVSNVQVFVNGVLDATASASTVSSSDVTIDHLLPGRHELVFTSDRFKNTKANSVNISSYATNSLSVTLYDVDRDYDGVGDRTEVESYGAIYKYDRSDDPDHDGLSNLLEFDQYRIHGVFMNAFKADTDADGMDDGTEMGYDGHPQYLARTKTWAEATPEGASSVSALFAGSFLAGKNYFGDASSNIFASIEGDRFSAQSVTNATMPPPTNIAVRMEFHQVPEYIHDRAVSKSHTASVDLFANPMPNEQDTDGDGMWDGYEYQFMYMTNYDGVVVQILDPLENYGADEDPDADGLTNYQEFLGTNTTPVLNGWTDPTTGDSNGNGIPDGWERHNGFDPTPGGVDCAYQDPDDDGLVNLSEYYSGTDPRNSDSDGDYLPDGAEVVTYETDPLLQDTDGDGLVDGREVWDKNGDGIQDGGFFPNWNGGDMDHDGLVDGPADPDTDGDGMPDGFEVMDAWGTYYNDDRLNPGDANDANLDFDNDGLTNLEEYNIKDGLAGNMPDGYNWDDPSNPFKADTDGDGMPDGYEAEYGLHPTDPIPYNGEWITQDSALGPNGDLDGDGLWNSREYAVRFYVDSTASSNALTSKSTLPWNPDSDGDGLEDGQEDRIFRSLPVLQDSDGDGLFDGTGIADRWGEVESTNKGFMAQVYVNAADFYAAQSQASAMPCSLNTNIAGHLLTLDSVKTYTMLRDAVIQQGLSTNDLLVLGGVNYEGKDNEDSWSWIDHKPYESSLNLFFTGMSPTNTLTPDVMNVMAINGIGQLVCALPTNTFVGFVTEWDPVSQATNHFDQALNDLWMLRWHPDSPDRPYWQKVAINTNNPARPLPRWGAGMTYIPVYETKNEKVKDSGDGAKELLDNRKLVLLGGRDGVYRYRDVWEFWIDSLEWKQSTAGMDMIDSDGNDPSHPQGISECSAVPVFGYKNTKSDGCDCNDVPYDCNGEGFGLPKNRPWENGSSSFDWTYVMGGWIQDNLYRGVGGISFYKSTDSKQAVTDEMDTDFAAGDYSVKTVATVIKDELILSAFTGTVVEVFVSQGERLFQSDTVLLQLRAAADDPVIPMKHNEAWTDEIAKLIVSVGDTVLAGDALASWVVHSNEVVAVPYTFKSYTVDEVNISVGAEVSMGDTLFVLRGIGNISEVKCPIGYDYYDVKSVNVSEGDQFGVNKTLLTVTGYSTDTDVAHETGGYGTQGIPLGDGTVRSKDETTYERDDQGNVISSTHVVDDVTIQPYNAFHFSGFNLNGNCERIEWAELKIEFDQAPGIDIDLEIAMEKGSPDTNYDLEPDGRPVSSRWGWDKTASFYTNITAGTKEVILSGSPLSDMIKEVITDRDKKDVNIEVLMKNSSTNGTDYIAYLKSSAHIKVSYVPSYKIEPYWHGGGTIHYTHSSDHTPIDNGVKSAGLAYDYKRGKMVMFGGIDGAVVYGQTYEGTLKFKNDFDADGQDWEEISTVNAPSARWGHGMVYDEDNGYTYLFGGFDADHQPLNDTWVYIPAYEITTVTTNITGTNLPEVVTNTTGVASSWTEITEFSDQEKPTPRGGFSMIYFGGNDYNRGIDDYCTGANKKMIMLFGGTDGNKYYNDLWMFNTSKLRWVLVNPDGPLSMGVDEDGNLIPGPQPRAFASLTYAQNALGTYSQDRSPSPCSSACAYLFGGRIGTIPTGTDTDSDTVEDGTEFALGGPAAGRDPRVNALIVTNTSEKLPFVYNKMGSMRYDQDVETRGAIADFESLRHDKPDVDQAAMLDLPVEVRWDEYSGTTYDFGQANVGVAAYVPGQSALWYHRYAVDDPFDDRDVWQLGQPNDNGFSSNPNGAPPYAHSGRWVWGTQLAGNYPISAAGMSLYSPLMSLKLPLANSTKGLTETNNNTLYLVFWEWLDLKDANDKVTINAIRPVSASDVSNRKSGSDKPTINLLPSRNNTANTDGSWRQTIVPLEQIANEEQVFFEFTLSSDSSGVSGGWYIDDVMVVQGAELTGAFTNLSEGTEIVLNGENFIGKTMGNMLSDADGTYRFGLLPLGRYRVGAVADLKDAVSIGWNNDLGAEAIQPLILTAITPGNPTIVEWTAVPGMYYWLESSDDLGATWNRMATIQASSTEELYMDYSTLPGLRFYRVQYIGSAPQ